MISAEGTFENYSDALAKYAALSGPFDPFDAIEFVCGPDIFADTLLITRLLTALQALCSVDRTKTGEVWLLRPGIRHKVMGDIEPEEALSLAASDTPVVQALLGHDSYGSDALAAMVDAPPDEETLTTMAIALDRAGPNAPGAESLSAVRSLLNTAQQVRQTNDALAAGFFGRVDELEQLRNWILNVEAITPVPAIQVSGLPGIGKSYLLERVVQMARIDPNPVIVRLDFDRSGLRVLDAHALFDEVSRQIGDGLPRAADQLRNVRLRSAEEKAELEGTTQGRDQLPRQLMNALSKVLQEHHRPLLFVLDTLEVLRSQGDTMIMTLFEHLDRLAEISGERLVVIAAGRGDALEPVQKRVAAHVKLAALEDWAAREMLETKGVAKQYWDAILPIAKGNPLLLTLASKAAEAGVLNPDDLPEDAPEIVVGGYLYRAILSRVPGHLKQVANLGLILFQLNAEVVSEVIAPALDIQISRDEAQAMLNELEMQHWLVWKERGWIKHRQDVRVTFLPLLYADSKVLAAEINRRARDWFADRVPHLSLYHALQLTRPNGPIPEIDPAIAADFEPQMLDDLPERARDAVLQAQNQRSDFGRAGHDADDEVDATPEPRAVRSSSRPIRGAWTKGRDGPTHYRYDPVTRRVVYEVYGSDLSENDERLLRDLEITLGRGDLREATYVLTNGLKQPVAVRTPLARLLMMHQWQLGHWTGAKQMFNLERDDHPDHLFSEDNVMLARAWLEMWAEFRFDDLRIAFADEKMFESARSVVRSSERSGMSGGALDFAFVASLTDQHVPDEGELGYSVIVHHMPNMASDPGAEALMRANRLREPFGLQLVSPEENPARMAPPDAARALYALNPYITPLRNLLNAELQDQVSPIGEYLQGLQAHRRVLLDELSPMLVWAASEGEPSRHPMEILDEMGALGFTADWAQGFAFHRSAPEISAVARAAERWRRTVAGRWSYGRNPPLDWHGTRAPFDATTLYEVNDMLSDKSPRGAALIRLRRWAIPTDAVPDGGRRRAAQRLASRYARVSHEIKGRDRHIEDVLAALQKRGVAGVIAAPLAVLLLEDVPVDDIFIK
jgi:hypothetical protein